MKRGIYLVANLKSQEVCENLIYSIRSTGCTLPIRLIHFGGKKVDSSYIFGEVEFLQIEDFSKEAQDFVHTIRTVLKDCPMGYLYRFLPFFGDWEEFVYSDNDIVALSNWDKLFNYLSDYDLVHADEEYTTEGRFNHEKPLLINKMFGEDALEAAITAGHFAARPSPKLIQDMESAVKWFNQYPDIPKKHDQALLHIALLLGKWKVLNLCKKPNNWLSSWSGDYKTPLELLQAIQKNGVDEKVNISHLHYSGSTPEGDRPIEELLFSNLDNKKRLKKIILASVKSLLGIFYLKSQKNRVKRKLKSMSSKNS